eukprot:gene3534-3985_t
MCGPYVRVQPIKDEGSDDIVWRVNPRTVADDGSPLPAEEQDPPVGHYPVCTTVAPDNMNEPVVFVKLDSEGIVTDHLVWQRVPSHDRSDNAAEMRERQEAEFVDLLNTGTKGQRPRALCIGAVSLRSLQHFLAVDDYVDKQDLDKPIHWARTDVAKVYAMSERAEAEFPDRSVQFRTAVSLGRFFREPLHEICGLFNRDRDALRLSLHPLQGEVPQDLLYERLEQTMCSVVCLSGVDINRTVPASAAHLQPCLQFVAGLGPHKAAALYKKLQALQDVVVSRQKLMQDLLSPKVYYNACAFLRLTDGAVSHSTGEMTRLENYLDSTRVHPDSYTFARDIACSANDLTELPKESDLKDLFRQCPTPQ